MIDSLLSDPPVRMLEQTLSFTEQRHQVLLNDIANASTPGFIQQDLPVAEFQGALQDALENQRKTTNDDYEPESTENIEFESGDSPILAKPANKIASVGYHDRGVRSMESIMSDLADNAMAHNMAAQFLKSRFDLLSRAISMRV